MSKIHIVEKYDCYGSTRYDVYHASGAVCTYFDSYLPPKVAHFMRVADSEELPLSGTRIKTVYTKPK